MDAGKRQDALARALAGDSQARGELLESFRPYLRVIARSFHDARLQARFDESDVLQDALLAAHQAFGSFRGRTIAELVAWLREIVIRSAGHIHRDHLAVEKRGAGREQPAEDLAILIADSASSPSEHAIRHEEAASMADALARLPDDMQQVLLGRHMDGVSYAEIAQRLSRSEGAVRVLYTRALRRLRELFRQES
jgi:RNA polymerase sigma-70 factor (ECF subfamily)